MIHPLPHPCANLGVDVTHRAWQLAGAACAQTGEGLLHGGAQIGALFIRVGGEYVDREHEARRGAGFGRFEITTVDGRGLLQRIGRKVRGKGIRQPKMRRQLRTV